MGLDALTSQRPATFRKPTLAKPPIADAAHAISLPPMFLDQLSQALRSRQCSFRNEQTYCQWVMPYIPYQSDKGVRCPVDDMYCRKEVYYTENITPHPKGYMLSNGIHLDGLCRSRLQDVMTRFSGTWVLRKHKKDLVRHNNHDCT